MLGSFWPNSASSFESRLVKAFKECCPVSGFEPHISHLCDFYSDLIIRAAGGRSFDWVVRVLSASETRPDEQRPQAMLADVLCRKTGARSATHIFFRSNARPSMRTIERLSGPDALKTRIGYVLQDLFVEPCDLGGSTLLVDDICNVGASMRVYARALKDFAGCAEVVAVNLAATRFSGGKDGRGRLNLDIAGLDGRPGMDQVWLDRSGLFHTKNDCAQISGRAVCEPRFVAQRKASPCPCVPTNNAPRKWWQLFGGRT